MSFQQGAFQYNAFQTPNASLPYNGVPMSDNTNLVQSYLGGLSGTFGSTWDAYTSQSVVDFALELYGVDTEAEMTDATKKKALLRYATWLKIRDELLLDPSAYKTDGESFQWDMKRLDSRVEQARQQAQEYLNVGSISLGRITFPDDPYSINGQVEHNA